MPVCYAEGGHHWGHSQDASVGRDQIEVGVNRVGRILLASAPKFRHFHS